MMGLLNAHTQDTLVITYQGKQAYIEQTYHLATANLYQANASRILSLIAIGVATPDSDVLRGLFQCVKYKTIMDAEDKIHGEKNNNKALLVIGGSLSSENQKVRDTLGITVIENIKC